MLTNEVISYLKLNNMREKKRNMLTEMIAKQQKDRDAIVLVVFWEVVVGYIFLITRLLVFIIWFLLFALFVSCTNNNNNTNQVTFLLPF